MTFENCDEVAAWCGGEASTTTGKVLGTEMTIPCVKVPGQGSLRSETFMAPLGFWIVGRKGNFRVHNPNQFEATFELVSADSSVQ